MGFKTDEAAIKRAEQGFKSLRGLALGVSAAVVAVGGSLFAMAKSTANAGDTAVKTAQKVGVTIEGFQRLMYAASLADVSQQGLATSLKFLSKNMVDAAEGGKGTSEAFKKLGINPKKYLGKTEDLFLAISDKIAGMKDGAEKTALAMKIFGKSGGDNIPLLNAGAKAIREMGLEAENFGIIIDEQTARMGEEFNDQLTRSGTILSGLKTIIGSALLPHLKRMVDAFVSWWKINGKLIRQKLSQFIDNFIERAKRVYIVTKRILSALKPLVDKFGGLGKAAKLAAIAIGLLYAVKTLNGIGNLVFGIVGVVSNLRKAAAAGTLFNSVLLGIPGLVFAIAVALGALIGYVISRWDEVKAAFSNAAIEIVGVWREAFSALFDYLISMFKETASVAAGLLNPLKVSQTIKKIKSGEAFSESNEANQRFQGAFGNLRERGLVGAMPLMDFWKTGFENLKPTLSSDFGALKNIFDSQSVLNQGPTSLISPSEKRAQIGSTGPVDNSKTITINPKVDVRVPAAELAAELTKQIEAWMGAALRTVSQATNTAAI